MDVPDDAPGHEPPPAVPLDPSDDLVAQLTRWLAEQRVDQAAAARSRERWLRQQAEEEGTFAGMLLDLGERERPVVVQTVAGRRHRGWIRAVAGDFVVLDTERAPDLLLPFTGIVSVQPEPRTPAAVGDRTVALHTTLGEVLVGLAGERPHVLVIAMDGTSLAGGLRAVGRDVLTVRSASEDRLVLHIALAAVAEIALTER